MALAANVISSPESQPDGRVGLHPWCITAPAPITSASCSLSPNPHPPCRSMSSMLPLMSSPPLVRQLRSEHPYAESSRLGSSIWNRTRQSDPAAHDALTNMGPVNGAEAHTKSPRRLAGLSTRANNGKAFASPSSACLYPPVTGRLSSGIDSACAGSEEGSIAASMSQRQETNRCVISFEGRALYSRQTGDSARPM